ncbi:MAG: sigma-70 family RNA polymerase sigma factor [Crocinitomicaceae bacterium]|jgi:RNA polymerase sigma-70 factor, ECF subfamily|nr:sigma-70 family RNA polymerase sigma factor [Crocinitomicaceae bacterium]MDP4723574.1 sigma-70 family RNA polymerase sigma factor [Crocinitomicaceae bacterium]MDP4738844.1 sigma-70 family RNA polymerase sigma factor [Crocinitomicaceae bacterium]MDP4799048.1 sigma-70 family RNA polymerase sigma factor [Crocinitomicaceae bacterium]MDP4805819.1 sigma-70 family RNA polymerase sigma factor [Crocinitomicaceae bacterium]
MILSQLSDSQLIQSYVAGKEEAFAQLLSRHQEAIFKFIYNKVKDSELANDLFQEAFVKVIQKLKLGAYNEEGKFLPWVLRIAHNLVIDHFRKQTKHRMISERHSWSADYNIFHRIASEDANFVQLTTADEIAEQLHAMMAHLPESQREMIYMRLFEERSFKEISESEGVSINTALGRMRYALLNLRKMIDDHALSMELS